MITGFNTDVRHGEVVFHVQTEDKGTGNPCVESLVYVGGQILARKRSGYQSLLEGDGAAAAVAKLMEQQHRAMIAEIRAGNMDAKVAELKGASVNRPEPEAMPAAESTRVEPPEVEDEPAAQRVKPPAVEDEPAAPPVDPLAVEDEPAVPRVEPPAVDRRTVAATPLKKLLGSPPKPPPPMPRESPKPRPAATAPPDPEGEPAADDRSLDQVILDYLEMESEQEKLILSMDRRSGDLLAGREATVTFRTRSSLGAEPIGDAQIVVRLISTAGEPMTLGEGTTDSRGQLELTLDVPLLKTGTGALIISAESSIGNAELRHLI